MMVAFGKTRIVFKRGDITRECCDAIVNAANSSLMGGGGVDGAIHRVGGPEIHEDCLKIIQVQGGCPTGEAVVTRAGDLPAQMVVHAVGPLWQGGNRGEEALLYSAYTNSLLMGARAGARTVAFPSISTGAYRFPIDRAASIALAAVRDYAEAQPHYDEVRFVSLSHEDLVAYEGSLEELVVLK